MFVYTSKIKIEDGKLVYDHTPGAIYEVGLDSYEWMCCHDDFNFEVVYKDFWRKNIYLCQKGVFYPWLIKRWMRHCSSALVFKCKCIALLHRAGFGYTRQGEILKWKNVLRGRSRYYGFISRLKRIRECQISNPDKFFDVMVSDHLMVGIRRSSRGFFATCSPDFLLDSLLSTAVELRRDFP